MDYYDDAAVKKGFSVWKLIKWLLVLITLAIYLLLTLRACALEGLKDTAKTRKLIWNDTLFAAYTASPDTFTVEASPNNSITSSDGAFTITNIRWIASIGQLQLTVRYNDSLARTIEDEFSLDSEPQGEYLTFALRDDAGNVYTTFEYITDEVFVYNFRRLVFDGVQLDGHETLRIEAYYTGYVNYDLSSAPVGALTIYEASDEFEPYEPKKNELPGETATSGLIQSRVWTMPDTNDTENE